MNFLWNRILRILLGALLISLVIFFLNSITTNEKVRIRISVPEAILQVREFSKKYQIETLVSKRNAIRQVFVLATWRSGSSFFGEALSSHPAIFYHYEPLMYMFLKQVRRVGEDLQTAFQTLGNLSQCEYSKTPNYTNYRHEYRNALYRNAKIHSQCIQLREKCLDFGFLKTACSLFPVHLFKLTRIRGKAAKELLIRFKGSKIIYLVRDPRAIYSSRLKVNWCPSNSSCGNISCLCEDLEEDYAEIRSLQAKQIKNVLLVRYEHLALSPEMILKQVYTFLGLGWHDNVQKYLNKHIHKNNDDPMSTFKDSIKHTYQWKNSLDNETVQEIQRKCKQFMINYRYKFINKYP